MGLMALQARPFLKWGVTVFFAKNPLLALVTVLAQFADLLFDQVFVI